MNNLCCHTHNPIINVIIISINFKKYTVGLRMQIRIEANIPYKNNEHKKIIRNSTFETKESLV